jgi:hypothetical protein
MNAGRKPFKESDVVRSKEKGKKGQFAEKQGGGGESAQGETDSKSRMIDRRKNDYSFIMKRYYETGSKVFQKEAQVYLDHLKDLGVSEKEIKTITDSVDKELNEIKSVKDNQEKQHAEKLEAFKQGQAKIDELESKHAQLEKEEIAITEKLEQVSKAYYDVLTSGNENEKAALAEQMKTLLENEQEKREAALDVFLEKNKLEFEQKQQLADYYLSEINNSVKDTAAETIEAAYTKVIDDGKAYFGDVPLGVGGYCHYNLEIEVGKEYEKEMNEMLSEMKLGEKPRKVPHGFHIFTHEILHAAGTFGKQRYNMERYREDWPGIEEGLTEHVNSIVSGSVLKNMLGLDRQLVFRDLSYKKQRNALENFFKAAGSKIEKHTVEIVDAYFKAGSTDEMKKRFAQMFSNAGETSIKFRAAWEDLRIGARI